MTDLVLIDGNNLLYNMHEHGPTRPVGRVALVRMIDTWARDHEHEVILVFDGSPPRGGLAKQMEAVAVRAVFSGSRTADDVMMDMMAKEPQPGRLLIVSSDNAIRHEAAHHKCRHMDCVAFIRDLFEARLGKQTPRTESHEPEKPLNVHPDEVEHWSRLFRENDDPLDQR